MYKKLLAFVFIISFILVATFSAIAQDQGQTLIVEGDVEILKAGGQIWETLEKGDEVSSGDTIKTKESSNAEIAIDKNAENIIRIEERSEFVLDNIKEQRTSLSQGRVFALLDNLAPGSDFEVRTPTAVCGVAGSGLSVVICIP